MPTAQTLAVLTLLVASRQQITNFELCEHDAIDSDTLTKLKVSEQVSPAL
jgi:hypothetical protein